MDWKCESANQTFHRWHLVASQSRKVAGRERGPRERPGGETVLADSEGTSRENRVATTRERRGGEGARKKGWGRAMSLLFLPPMPLRHPARVKCIWKWMRAGRCSGDCCGFAGVSQEPQALSKGSSDAVMYVLATCGVREQPQERRGSR